MKQKAVFLDRDGVLNEERGDYVWLLEDFKIVPGIIDVLKKLKSQSYLLIVVTNQAGIAKGRYTQEQMQECHDYFQKESGDLIDHFYYAPNHPDFSESLTRKPDSLMWEKAMAKFNIDPLQSWMIGDKERDLIPAKKFGMKTIRIFLEGYYQEGEETIGDYGVKSVREIMDCFF
ncbi:MAG: HAD-IIIA family hydrolase [Cytophagales bacterium]|nr:HAD-IIIA family hydrolase [Cytophagales bacterium]